VQNAMLRTAAAISVARQVVALKGAQTAERVRREQSGQDVLEYAGMIVLVATVIALLFALNVPTAIHNAVRSAVNSIFSRGSSSYSAPTLK
jgi:hypothetical protein